jgi:hypothetical protein
MELELIENGSPIITAIHRPSSPDDCGSTQKAVFEKSDTV